MGGMIGEMYSVDKLSEHRFNQKLKRHEFLVHWLGWEGHAEGIQWEPYYHLDPTTQQEAQDLSGLTNAQLLSQE